MNGRLLEGQSDVDPKSMLRTGALVDRRHDTGTNPVNLLFIPTGEELEIPYQAAQEIQACG